MSKSVIKWNVWFSNEFARWAAQNAAVAAGWAAEQAEDEAEWAAEEAILTLKIGEMVREGVGADRSPHGSSCSCASIAGCPRSRAAAAQPLVYLI